MSRSWGVNNPYEVGGTGCSGGHLWDTAAANANGVVARQELGVCVFITAVPITKLFARGGGNGGHVLRETTSRGQCELVCPSLTNERGGEGDCVK